MMYDDYASIIEDSKVNLHDLEALLNDLDRAIALEQKDYRDAMNTKLASKQALSKSKYNNRPKHRSKPRHSCQ
jgi:hypothetical protein